MGEKDRGYDAFELFEEILSEENASGQEKASGGEQMWYAEKIRRRESGVAESLAALAEESAEDMSDERSEQAGQPEWAFEGVVGCVEDLAEETARIAEWASVEAERIGERIDEHTSEGIAEWSETERERALGDAVGGNSADATPQSDMYYEIEYDSSPIPGAGKFVLKRRSVPEKIQAPPQDPIRLMFDQMRDIARANRSLLHNSSRFYDRRIQQEKANIFYQQGMFMKDFEDDYEVVAPYNSYYPYYQMMGYDQLRTFFTWRTKVRRGIVEEISLSYAYLYIYELLNNIGVEDPWEGLEELMYFWREFRTFNDSIDKYMLRWLKDYHIYYEMEESFQEFVYRYNLVEFFPYLSDSGEDFDLYCALSKYDIRKSKFYTEETKQRIQACFYFTFDRLREVFAKADMPLEEAVFQPTKNLSLWQPFREALFHPWLQQRDRRVVLSDKEIYICKDNRWMHSSTLTTESGKQLVGYVMKQMEVALRKAMNYKHKLTADTKNVHPVLLARLTSAGISLEEVINGAVAEYYKEATKTVVRVDFDSLAKIRREAFETQEKLVVEEEEATGIGQILGKDGVKDAAQGMERPNPECPKQSLMGEDMGDSLASPAELPAALEKSLSGVNAAVSPVHLTPWESLRAALTPVELEALGLVLDGGAGLKALADGQGVMLEVLMDGINEKAMDFVGDSLFDEEFVLYEDYIEEVRSVVGR